MAAQPLWLNFLFPNARNTGDKIWWSHQCGNGMGNLGLEPEEL